MTPRRVPLPLAAATSAVLRPLLAITFLTVSAGPALAYYALGVRGLGQSAEAAASEIAGLISQEAGRRAALWRYDTPKLLEHLWIYERREGIAAVRIVDAGGAPIPVGAESAALAQGKRVRWARAPVRSHDQEVGAVWVAVSLLPLERTTLGLLGLCALAGLLLTGALHAIPLRALRRAERQQAASGRALDALEADRRAIARDLHDGVGQSLTALRIELELLAKQDAGAPKVATRAERAEALLDGILEDFRRVLGALGPAVLEDLGFEGAVRRLVDDAKARGALDASVTVHLTTALRAREEVALYRIVQEAVTNVLRHAAASRVDVVCEGSAGALHLTVTDDGRGFDPAAIASDRHGLRGIRERAELLSGEARIASTPGGGTRIEVTIPLAGA